MRNNLSEPLDRCYMADETVSGEPVSEDKFPAEQGKYSDLGRKWPAPTPKIV